MRHNAIVIIASKDSLAEKDSFYLYNKTASFILIYGYPGKPDCWFPASALPAPGMTGDVNGWIKRSGFPPSGCVTHRRNRRGAARLIQSAAQPTPRHDDASEPISFIFALGITRFEFQVSVFRIEPLLHA